MQSFPRSSNPEAGDTHDLEMECYACEATFRNREALSSHKIQMREEEYFNDPYLTHIYCHYCDQDFVTERAGKAHWDQFHAEKQDIKCPGCNMHFVQFSAFVHHVEFHECPIISQDTAAARCQKELDFARALERIDRMGRGINRTKDFTTYLGGDREHPPTNHLPARSAITNWTSDPWPSENPWASVQTGLKPMQEQIMQLQLFDKQDTDNEWHREEQAMTRARGVVQADPDDPKGRDFDPKRLFCPYTKLYKCPRCKKGKGFKSMHALEQHRKSAAHAFVKTVACPYCKDTFKHLFSLAAHVESADKKCNLKHTDIFEIFLGQLTWNLVEVAGEHKSDGTTKFAISKKAEHEYGVVKPAQPQLTFGQYDVPASEPGTTRLQLTSRAVSQLEKQSDKPLPQPKALEQPFAAPWQSELQQQQFPPLHQAQQPSQARSQTRSVQSQAEVQAQYQYQQQSLQQGQQSQSSQARTQNRYQSQPQPSQHQQPPQQLAQYQPRPSVQERPQEQRPQAQQQPVSLGNGLTELALAQIPAFPSEDHVSSEEAWSNDGDGDAGW